MHLLVDLDGVLADWDKLFAHEIRTRYSHLHFPFLENNHSWDMGAGLEGEHLAAIYAVKNLPGFYANLDPIEGSVEAVHEMEADGHIVHFVTAPTATNPTCASDKLDWIEKHVGKGWADKAVISGDKTLVRGDYLFDDRPDILGAYDPIWDHVVVDAPYNRHINDHRIRIPRLADWKKALEHVNA